MIAEVKKHMQDVVNLSIQYVNYNFTSNYYNCLLVNITKGDLNKNNLVFLTEDGTTKSINIEDENNIKVSVKPLCQK